MSVQQHAYSIKQTPVISTPPQFRTSSPPSVATSTMKHANYDTVMKTPDKMECVSKGKEVIETDKCTQRKEDGVCSTFQDTTEVTSSDDVEPMSKKRKWFSFFG